MNLSTFTTSDLATAFNAMTGSAIKKFENRQKAEARVSAVLLERGLDVASIAQAVAKPTDQTAPAKKTRPSLTDMAAAVDAGEKIDLPEPQVVAPAKPARVRKVKAEAAVVARGKTKKEIMLDMVCAPGGATEAEICEAIGWKACLVTLRRSAAAAGVTLRAEKPKGGKSRFFGTR